MRRLIHGYCRSERCSRTGTTDSFGLAVFVINKARKGTYTLTVDDVVVEDHPFDIENSVLSASIFKRR